NAFALREQHALVDGVVVRVPSRAADVATNGDVAGVRSGEAVDVAEGALLPLVAPLRNRAVVGGPGAELSGRLAHLRRVDADGTRARNASDPICAVRGNAHHDLLRIADYGDGRVDAARHPVVRRDRTRRTHAVRVGHDAHGVRDGRHRGIVVDPVA